MNYTKSLSEISKEDVVTTGGKGSSLGELLRAGMPVPPGFVVLSSAYDRFKTEGKIPSDVAEEIRESFKKLDARRVAVRSSATAEDSKSASWAGQLDSYLNTTEDTLLENVQRCWESLESARSKFYRSEQGLTDTEISVAVVIQEMVQSKVAGTAFSVHPVTEDMNQLVIEAGLGLGEVVVGGTITPDMYVVAKDTRSIVEKEIHAQGKYTGQKLSDEEILKLAELVLKIEKHHGFPADVEWAFADGKLYIVQSRPITTLARGLESKTIYRKMEVRSICLLDCEIWDEGERVALPQMTNRAYALDPLSEYKKGLGVATFYNFTDPAQAPGRLFECIASNRRFLADRKKDFATLCGEIRGLTARDTNKDFQILRQYLIRILPIISISILVANWDCRDKDVLSVAMLIRKESDDVLHSGLEKLMQMAEDLLPKQYKKWVEYLLFDEIHSGELPSEDELARRKEGYVYHNGALHTKTLLEYASENNLEIQDYDGEKYLTHDKRADTLKGTSACSGKQKGRVTLVFERSDITKVQEGDILVTAMTTPNLAEAMKRASAFITDEGGITCHAAIVARELGKPCVIGTKIATRALHDGDMVEVDADTGIVRILATLPEIHSAEFWARESSMPLFWLTDTRHNMGAESIIFYKNRRFHLYHLNDSQKEKEESGREFFSKKQNVIQYEETANEFIQDVESALSHHRDFSLKELAAEELEILFTSLSDKLFRFGDLYEKTEASNTHSLGNSSLNLESLARLRLELRKSFSGLFGIFIGKLTKELARRHKLNIKGDLFFYDAGEIDALLREGKKVDEEIILKRRAGYAVLRKDATTEFFHKKESDVLWKKVNAFVLAKNPTEIKGAVVFGGVVRGKVRVIRQSFNNRIIASGYCMQPGEILVTDMTKPDMMLACKISAAIVTDEGGIISHASILARELGKTCIVGTKIATQVLHTGDLVEVNAENGTVSVIKKARR